MSQRALRLPLRLASQTPRSPAQWVCRRCLATQTDASTPAAPLPISQWKDPSEATNYDPTLTASQRDYKLKRSDFYLKRGLPHAIPPQYLMNSTSTLLPEDEQQQRDKTPKHKGITGVVVDTGKMDKTVKVRVPGQMWNKKIKKFFQVSRSHKVHDPNSSLIVGDVVELHKLHVSTAVHHVVARIISPFGTPISERPPIPTPDERLAKYKEQRFAKLHRRSLRREAAKGNADAIKELRDMGLDPGRGVEAGKGETANAEAGAGKMRTPTKGAILGNKGQKLPEGVLPGGKHEVGKINVRAQQNKRKAMRMEAQAERNLLEAEQKGQELEEMGLAAESVLPTGGKNKSRV